MLSFYEDLKTDTTMLGNLIMYDDDKISGLNNMDACYDSISANTLASECMTNLIIHSRANRSFTITDRTVTQLVNAGGFRILDNDDADSVLSYVNMFKSYQDFQATIFQSSQDNVRNTLNELASYKSIRSLLQIPGSSYGTTTSTITPDMLQHGPVLFSSDLSLLNKWFNQLAVYLRITRRQRLQLMDMKAKASALIQYSKKKYHLE
jgi:hypothetical protein